MNNGLLVLTACIAIFTGGCTAVLEVTPKSDDDKRLFFENGLPWTITCKLNSPLSPHSRVEWLGPDGEPISTTANDLRVAVDIIDDATEVKLHFMPIRKVDEGTYTCVERLANGNRRDPQIIKLNVIEQPSVVEIHCDSKQYIRLGTTDTVRCLISPPSVEVSWTFIGDSNRPARRRIQNYTPRYRFLNGGSLEIRNVQMDDGGTYTVSAISSETGATNDATIHVRVIEKPTLTAPLRISSGTPIENREVTIECQARGDPTPEIHWYNKNHDLITTTKRIAQVSGELHIRELQPVDSGRYYCVASNMAGNVTNYFDLRVVVKPRIESFASQTIPRGASLLLGVFQCRVIASDGVNVQLWKGGQLLSPTINSDDSRVFVERFQAIDANRELVEVSIGIRIDSVFPDDAATYLCNASTAAGWVARSANLTVLHKPEIQNTESDQECIQKDDRQCVISCSVLKGAADVMVEWWRGNEKLVNGSSGNRVLIIEDNSDLRVKTSRLQLLVRVVNYHDTFNTFHCVATNYYGNASHTFTVHEAKKPAVPTVTVTYSTPTTVFFELSPPINVNLQYPIVHYTVRHTLVRDDLLAKTVSADVNIEKYFGFRNLLAGRRYLFQVAAVSEAGAGSDVSLSPTPMDRRRPYACEIVSAAVSSNKTSYLARWRIPNDGGVRISEYKIVYEAVASDTNKGAPVGVQTELRVQPTLSHPPSSNNVQLILTNDSRYFEPIAYEQQWLYALADATVYKLTVMAVNTEGHSDQATLLFTTFDDGTHAAALAAATRSLVAIWLVVALVIAIIAGDIAMHFCKQKGFTHCVIQSWKAARAVRRVEQPPRTSEYYDFDSAEQRFLMTVERQRANRLPPPPPPVAINGGRHSLRHERHRRFEDRDRLFTYSEDRNVDEEVDGDRRRRKKRTSRRAAERPEEQVDDVEEWRDENANDNDEPDRADSEDIEAQLDAELDDGDNLSSSLDGLPQPPAPNSFEEVIEDEANEHQPPTSSRAGSKDEVSRRSDEHRNDEGEGEGEGVGVSVGDEIVGDGECEGNGNGEGEDGDSQQGDTPLSISGSSVRFGGARGAHNPNYSDASRPLSPSDTRQARSPAKALNGDGSTPSAKSSSQKHGLASFMPPSSTPPGTRQFAPPKPPPKPRIAHSANHQPVEVELHHVPAEQRDIEVDAEAEAEECDCRPDAHAVANGNHSGTLTNGVGAQNGVSHAFDGGTERKNRHAASAYSPAHAAPSQQSNANANASAAAVPTVPLSLPPPAVIQEFSF